MEPRGQLPLAAEYPSPGGGVMNNIYVKSFLSVIIQMIGSGHYKSKRKEPVS